MGVGDRRARGKASSEREKGGNQDEERRIMEGEQREKGDGGRQDRTRERALRSLGAHSVCGAPYPSPTSTRTHREGQRCKSQAPTSSPLQPEAQCIGSDFQPFHQPWLGPVDSGNMGGGYCPKMPKSREEPISVASPTSSGS